jgi:transcriptional regulator GlxA family with amidase domain
MWAGRRGLFDSLTEPLVVDFADAPRMKEVFAALLAEQATDAPGRTQMMAALMQQCLVELFRRLCGRDDCQLPWLNALEDPRLARALQAIHAAPEQPHSLESLAAAAAMSRSAFATRFRVFFGQTAMDYLRDVRLREAARLLRQPDISVEGAATRAGFVSRSHFTRAFRTMFGKAPGEYRRLGA